MKHSLAGLFLWLVAPPCLAVNTTPIPTKNTLPVMQGAGLGKPQSAKINNTSPWTINVNASLQSHANDAGSQTESLLIDSEVHSVVTNLQWNFAPAWQLALQLEGLRNTSGHFDGTIDRWHDLFGLDAGDRSRQARDQINIEYHSPESATRINHANSGLGDTRISLGYQLQDRLDWQLAIYSEVNLPTGKPQSLLGSDKTDLSLGLAAARSGETFGWHANLGVVAIGDKSLFGIATQTAAWFSSLGTHWQINQNWRISAQLDGHARVFVTSVDEIGGPAWQLSLSGERKLGKNGASIQAYFSEDISVNRTADFLFGVKLHLPLMQDN